MGMEGQGRGEVADASLPSTSLPSHAVPFPIRDRHGEACKCLEGKLHLAGSLQVLFAVCMKTSGMLGRRERRDTSSECRCLGPFLNFHFPKSPQESAFETSTASDSLCICAFDTLGVKDEGTSGLKGIWQR